MFLNVISGSAQSLVCFRVGLWVFLPDIQDFTNLQHCITMHHYGTGQAWELSKWPVRLSLIPCLLSWSPAPGEVLSGWVIPPRSAALPTNSWGLGSEISGAVLDSLSHQSRGFSKGNSSENINCSWNVFKGRSMSRWKSRQIEKDWWWGRREANRGPARDYFCCHCYTKAGGILCPWAIISTQFRP